MVRSAFRLTEWKGEASEMRKPFWIWAALGVNTVRVCVCVCAVLVNMAKFTSTNPKHKSSNQIKSWALSLLFPPPPAKWTGIFKNSDLILKECICTNSSLTLT